MTHQPYLQRSATRRAANLPDAPLLVFLLIVLVVPWVAAAKPVVIAHRGASGYLPEHTLEAKVLAHAMGSDYLEQDVVLSKDNQPVVLHDIYLDAISDVRKRFSNRARPDGKHYVVDFTLAELRTLSLHERVSIKRGTARFPDRFAVDLAIFRIHTLAQELGLIQELNRTSGRNIGVYVEIKDPRWHRANGKDLTSVVINELRRFGYEDNPQQAYIQSFDPQPLKRLKFEFKTAIPLVQLVGENHWWPTSGIDFDPMKTAAGLDEITKYASGMGYWMNQLYRSEADSQPASGQATLARARGLAVHTYTARADQLPRGIASFEDLLNLLVGKVRVDGIFTDHPDKVLQFLSTRK
jgi:glycerophosphoryl diester phosphodiesterase